MHIEEGSVLQKRYRLDRAISSSSSQRYTLWAATENPDQNDESPCLIGVWPYEPYEEGGRKPAPLLMTLWSRDLRHQLRLSSLAGASDSLLVLQDAGIDEEVHCFFTVHRAEGQNPQPLSDLLKRRKDTGWLSAWKEPPARARLWRGLLRVAEGLSLLHSQQMIHRSLGDHSILVDAQEGPETFRVSGHEWTLRLGDRGVDSLPVRPPELADTSFSRATDWFLYGVLCTKVLIGTPATPHPTPLLSLLERLRTENKLFDLERNFLERLIDENPQSRISRSEEVKNEISTILQRLEEPLKQRTTHYLALVVDVGRNSKLTQQIRDLMEQDRLSQRIEKEKENQLRNPSKSEPLQDPGSGSAPPEQRDLLEWVEKDIKQGEQTLIRLSGSGSQSAILHGQRLQYKILEHLPRQGTWELAYTNQTWDIRGGGHQDEQRIRLPCDVRVHHADEIRNDRGKVVDRARSWKPFMAQQIEAMAQSRTQELFINVLRLTNQIDALIHDAKIFRYEIVDQEIGDQNQYLALKERPRDQDPPEWARRIRKGIGPTPMGQMLEDLRNEEVRIQPENPRPRVHLGASERLRLYDKVQEKDLWEAVEIEEVRQSCQALTNRLGQEHENLVFVRRSVSPTEVEKRGYLRPADLWRNSLLVQRRQRAIDALPQHNYLLRGLLQPDLARIHLKHTELPLSLDQGIKKSEQLDDAKRKALRQLWQTQPVFTLQGPPGTGKTTLVTALLRQIFAQDENAQVLVTAQAHPAVDTLRERVNRAYKDTQNPPLAIRMKIKGSERQRDLDRDYPEQVANRLLEAAHGQLKGLRSPTQLQQDWLEVVKRLKTIDAGSRTDPDAGPFLELLRRAANITYCTSTAGDLSALATRTQSFDWCIIEEAAKAHGHDLVLPLQLSYRWLLIGDHYQLRPHRYRDFQDALADLPTVMRRLKFLMDRGNTLIDRELVQRYYPKSDDTKLSDELDRLRVNSTDWIRFFEELFKRCGAVDQRATERDAESAVPLAQILDQQHRMHPVIADLVSKAFYESQTPPSKIRSMTKDKEGNPAPRVRHAFVTPIAIQDKALLWIDVPSLNTQEIQSGTDEGFWCSKSEAHAIERFLHSLQIDPELEKKLYQNEEDKEDLRKLKLAVLSPYRKQVFSKALRDAVRGIYQRSPPWLRPAEPHQDRPRTVDGYQGNEAALVVVSLVRNNSNKDPKLALGFLQELERINVLFSRAERLLVLVGCWDFFKRVSQILDKERSLQEWPTIIKYLEEAFSNKTAVRIHMDDLPERGKPA